MKPAMTDLNTYPVQTIKTGWSIHSKTRRVQTTWPRIVPRVEGWEKHSELKIGYPTISSAFPHLMSAHLPARLPFDPDQEPPKTL
jgi:hypothetical protein